MHSHALDGTPLPRPPLAVDVDALQRIQRLPPVDHAPEHGVLAVQVRRRRVAHEELAAVGVGAPVGHADDAARGVAQRRPDLVGEEAGRGGGGRVDGHGRLGLGVAGGRAGLDHEGRDVAVEGRAVVEGGGAQREEVLGRARHRGAEELELQVTVGRVELGERGGKRVSWGVSAVRAWSCRSGRSAAGFCCGGGFAESEGVGGRRGLQ